MISERLEHNTITISIHGVFDTETAEEFALTAQRAYRMGFRDFYVSLKAVTMIDKSGLTLLSNVMHLLQQQGCTSTFIHLPFAEYTELDTKQDNPQFFGILQQYSNHDAIHSLIA